MLPGREGPEDLVAWCARLAPHAAELIPALVNHLSRTNRQIDTESDTFDHAGTAASCRALAALQACGFDQASLLLGPVLTAFLAERPDTGDKLHSAARILGPLRACKADESDLIAALAALALRAAGPAVAAAAAAGVATSAAVVTPDQVVCAAWTRTRAVRPVVAAGLLRAARAGQALPAGLRELLVAELAEVRRLGNDGAPKAGYRYNRAADEALRADCTALLAHLDRP
ncbi:hypothetical protein OG455_31605 [Kitasatospora sp. NBC_01287]|uniref:hypothetical protein n=1 Tax=Kitasatospora sp. NBC_01287 TaxID=2903573 RepID=UPI00224F0FEE|nr:hypothetical protein [Kitasatospora sp. NBC_01287]MCX4750012.1 hypothetical protein [Kitasatospora sp. NBC_01287]